MTREIRSRRAGLSRDQARQQPLYARLLGLQYLTPSGFLCFIFLEGAIALGVLLALAELVSWWGVLALPVTVAGMVKLNDVVAGMLSRPAVSAARVSGVRVDSYRAADAPTWDSFDGDASDTCSLQAVPASAPAASESAASESAPPEFAGSVFPSSEFVSSEFASSGLPEVPAARRVLVRPATMDAHQVSSAPVSTAPDAAGWTASSTASVRTRSAAGGTDASALNGPPAARQWGSQADDLDTSQQWARQAATHHYD